MFPFIPYEHIQIQTSLIIDEVSRVISQAIVPFRMRKLWENPKVFTGNVSTQGFTLSRPKNGIDNGMPVLYGKFISTDKGTLIDIRMTLHPWIIFWLIFFAVFVFALMGDKIFVAGNNSILLLGLSPLFLFYFLTIIEFEGEVITAKEILEKLLGKYSDA